MIVIEGVRGDMIMSACLRSDLAPIPFTFEAQIRVTQQTAANFKDGKVITVNKAAFRIVKSLPVNNAGGGAQGKEPLSAVTITAFADGLQALGLPRTSAVIFENASLAGIYRACGATVPFQGNFTVDRFACMVGSIPTFHIARVLQEESAVVMWRGGTIKAMSLRDLIAQAPIDSIGIDSSEDVRSEYLIADEIPVFFSIAADGSFVSAPRRDAAQKVTYAPRQSMRSLNLMGRVLVRRKTLTGKVNPSIRAGDVLNVAGTPMVVMTVAQFLSNGADGGDQNQYTRTWLGTLS